MRFIFSIWVVYTTLLATTLCPASAQVNIPPVTIHANAPGAHVYRESYPIKLSLHHTELDLNFDWDNAHVLGKAYITVSPYFYPQERAVLDANGFDIHHIARIDADGDQPLQYNYNGKKIDIALGRPYQKGEEFKLYIEYTAKPNALSVGDDIDSPDDRGLYFIQPNEEENNTWQLWSQGETEANSSWFPTINNTMLKMTQQISLTVPEKMVTLSNGLLDYSSINGDGTRTDVWRQDKVHAPYLTMIAAGEFEIVEDHWRDKEVNYYLEPRFSPHARMIFGKTPEMMEFFSQKLGVDYPWDKYHQIVVRDFVSGAMENTSASVFFERMNMTPAEYKDETFEDIIAHELFHHWFGDLVTAESWANLPLNEAFATYGEYLWLEHAYGVEAADMHALNDVMAYFAKGQNAELDLIRFDYAHREQMFDAVSYQKGGRVLHMLRKEVGDDAFFASLQHYLEKHAYQSVEIHDLRIAFEEITGKDLNWFFNQWFLAAGHPELLIETHYDEEKKQAILRVIQQQNLNSTPLYRLPIAIDIYGQGKVERLDVTMTTADTTIVFPTDAKPDLVNVDADKYLLASKQEEKTIAESLFQYRNAPLFFDRFEACQNMFVLFEEDKKMEGIMEVVQELIKDKSWIIRMSVLNEIHQLPKKVQEASYEMVKEQAINDERSYVRASAIVLLKTIYRKKDNSAVLLGAEKDDAPSVREALALK